VWLLNLIEVALPTLQMKPFQFAKKMQKIRDFKVDLCKFFWGIAHRPLMERGYGAPSQTYPPRRFAPPANRSEAWVPPSALPGNKADLWIHCPTLWSGAATAAQRFCASSSWIKPLYHWPSIWVPFPSVVQRGIRRDIVPICRWHSPLPLIWASKYLLCLVYGGIFQWRI